MKILYAGYPKTGTKSMSAALTILGYRCLDFDENFYVNGDKWLKIMKEENYGIEIFREMFKDYDATMDTPVFMYWEDILEAFPDIKIITCIRDEKSFIQSLWKQAESFKDNELIKKTYFFSTTTRKFVRYIRTFCRLLYAGSESFFPWRVCTGFKRDIWIKQYRQHNSHVIRTAPKDRLLVLKMGDGWEPLCRFLGKAIPKEPYPHANQGASLLKTYEKESPLFLKMKEETKSTLSYLVCVLAVILCFALGLFYK